MSLLRAVMDTNVLVAAFRSRQGASFELLRRLRRGEWSVMLSNHLLYEYEELLKHEGGLHLSESDVDNILNFLCARGEEWPLAPGWTPVLSDADDEPLVQLAHESGAMRIISFNMRHLAPAETLGIHLLKPSGFLDMLKAQSES